MQDYNNYIKHDKIDESIVGNNTIHRSTISNTVKRRDYSPLRLKSEQEKYQRPAKKTETFIAKVMDEDEEVDLSHYNHVYPIYGNRVKGRKAPQKAAEQVEVVQVSPA